MEKETAIKVLKELHDKSLFAERTALETLIPELKESENEKIRKAIHIYLDWLDGHKDYQPKGDYTIKDMIAWLEKQGNESVNIDIESMVSSYEKRVVSQCNGVRNNPIVNMCVSAFRHGVENTLEELNLKKLENQGGQMSSINIPSRDVILAIWDLGNEWKELTNGSISTEYGTQLDYIQKHWHESEYYLKEKQGEQNPADKVEAKFKIGDWVVYNRTDHSREVMQIYDIRDNRYYFNDNTHFSWSVKECDEKSHLWSIKEAREGDVLATESGKPFIFKGFLDKLHPNSPVACCEIDNSDNFYVGVSMNRWTDGKVYPASIEQHELLFRKMKEAGYE